MIRYRRLYESENSDIKLYDTVKCAGFEWYVIDIEGDIVTLLAKNLDFGKHVFSSNTNDYRTSEIRNYLQTDILSELINAGANPIPTTLSDVGCTDKVWLLSSEESKKLPEDVLTFRGWWPEWWLRTPADPTPEDNGMEFVLYMRYLYYKDAVVSTSRRVRPAMRVHIEDLEG